MHWQAVRRLLIAWAALSVVACGGCSSCCPGQECTKGTSVCDGGVLIHCGPIVKADPGACPEEATEWGAQGYCGSADLCAQNKDMATCVLSSSLLPGCDPASTSSVSCDAGAWTQCFLGRPIVTSQCGWCGEPDAGSICRGYIGDGCDGMHPCAAQAECHTFQPDSGSAAGSAVTLCSRQCSQPSDCKPVTGIQAAPATAQTSSQQPLFGWPVDGPDPVYKCVNGWCVLADPH